VDNSKYRALHPLGTQRQRLDPDNLRCEDTAGDEKKQEKNLKGKARGKSCDKGIIEQSVSGTLA
jgi:hypothetical protein